MLGERGKERRKTKESWNKSHGVLNSRASAQDWFKCSGQWEGRQGLSGGMVSGWPFERITVATNGLGREGKDGYRKRHGGRQGWKRNCA